MCNEEESTIYNGMISECLNIVSTIDKRTQIIQYDKQDELCNGGLNAPKKVESPLERQLAYLIERLQSLNTSLNI